MEIPVEMLKEIRESGYDQELVYNYIRELLNSDKQIVWIIRKLKKKISYQIKRA